MQRGLCIAVALTLAGVAMGQEPPRLDANGDPLPPGAVMRLGTRAWRHNGDAYFAAWSPDSKRLAITCNYRQIRLFDGGTGQPLLTFAPKDAKGIDLPWCIGVAFSPDGLELAIRAPQATVLTYEASTGSHRRTYQTKCKDFGDIEGGLKYSPNGKHLAASFSGGNSASYAVVDRKSGEPIIHEAVPGLVRGLGFTAGGDQLVIVATQPAVRVWDLKKREIIRRSEVLRTTASDRNASVSADGRWVAGGKQEIAVLDVARDRIIARLAGDEATEEFVATAFSPNGELFFAAASRERVYVWNTADWSRRQTLACKGRSACAIVIRPDGRWAGMLNNGHRLYLWDLGTGRLLDEGREEHLSAITSVAVSPDTAIIATGTHGAETRLWNATSGEHLKMLDASALRSTFLEDGRQVLTAGSRPPQLQTWEVAIGQRVHTWSGGEYASSIALSADRRHVSVLTSLGRSHAVQKVALPALAPIDTLTRTGLEPTTHAISTDGRLVALPISAGVELRDIHSDALIAEFPGVAVAGDALAFTPDGRFLVAGCRDKSLRVWELATLRPVHVLDGHKRMVYSLTFSETGRVVVAGEGILTGVIEPNDPQQIVFWDLATGKQLAALSGHNADVFSLTFFPDETRLVSGHRDTTALVWTVPAAALQRKLPIQVLDESEMKALWKQLASEDAKAAQAAIARLMADPNKSLTAAEQELHPAASVDAASLAPLIAQLDAEAFAQRDAAFNKLAALGSLIVSELKTALPKADSAEVRQRLGELIKLAETRFPYSPGRLAESRAVQLLEWIGDERAAALLRKLGAGAADAHLTKEAKAAVERLSGR